MHKNKNNNNNNTTSSNYSNSNSNKIMRKDEYKFNYSMKYQLTLVLLLVILCIGHIDAFTLPSHHAHASTATATAITSTSTSTSPKTNRCIMNTHRYAYTQSISTNTLLGRRKNDGIYTSSGTNSVMSTRTSKLTTSLNDENNDSMVRFMIFLLFILM
jgi:hypothetical protein